MRTKDLKFYTDTCTFTPMVEFTCYMGTGYFDTMLSGDEGRLWWAEQLITELSELKQKHEKLMKTELKQKHIESVNKETGPAWVVETNTNLTDGCGYNFPLYIAETEATARRLGKGGYVQGTNCPIRQIELIKVKGQWYGPVLIHVASKEDKFEQSRIDREKQVLARAKELGLTEAEIKVLRS